MGYRLPMLPFKVRHGFHVVQKTLVYTIERDKNHKFCADFQQIKQFYKTFPQKKLTFKTYSRILQISV